MDGLLGLIVGPSIVLSLVKWVAPVDRLLRDGKRKFACSDLEIHKCMCSYIYIYMKNSVMLTDIYIYSKQTRHR